MEAGPDASTCNLFGKSGQVGPAVGYAGGRRAGRRDLRNVVGPKYRSDNTRDGAALDTMCAGVFRMHRRGSDRLPGRLKIGPWVAIDIGVANCRDGPPEVVVVLGIQHSDDRVVKPK